MELEREDGVKQRKRKTDEEYVAIGMLLGLKYDSIYHAFFHNTKGKWYSPDDPEKELKHKELMSRLWRYRNAYPS